MKTLSDEIIEQLDGEEASDYHNSKNRIGNPNINLIAQKKAEQTINALSEKYGD